MNEQVSGLSGLLIRVRGGESGSKSAEGPWVPFRDP